MGLDFGYLLFFKRSARFDVLEGLAEIADFDITRQTALILPDQVKVLPFEGWLDTGRQIAWDDPGPKWDFMTVLRFELDEAIVDYLDRLASYRNKQRDEGLKLDNYGRVGIGIIYLSVYFDMQAFTESAYDPDLVLFHFDTPGTTMSILFVESKSIRQAFIALLETCQGVYGILDKENEAEVIWFKGQEVSVTVPHAYLSLPEIEAYVMGER